VRQDPVLSRVKLISEPWDPGPGGYQLGNHPPGFAEWNDRFRDGVRRFWRGDEGQRSDFAARLAGSSDLFERRRRRPWASINYVASHDGFTLRDVVSYAERHNEANGEDNKDGHAENLSANWGVEGPTDDPAINQIRFRLQCAMIATVFLAQGTPMLLAGDEFGRSQNGNNNAYAQDNETSWIDWSLLDGSEGRLLTDFTARIIALRHRHPVLRCANFLHGRDKPAPDVLDIAWFDEQGESLSPEAWNNPQERTLVLRRAAAETDGRVPILTCLFNPTPEDRSFKLPPPGLPTRLLLDSADPAGGERDIDGETVGVKARSVVLVRSVYRK
jgi:glycogen operon protein